MIEKLKAVVEKASSTIDKAKFYNEITKNPGVILDVDAATFFLLSDIENIKKYEILVSIENFISNEKNNREHVKGYKKDLKAIYVNWEYKKFISFNEFVKLYNSINKICVDCYAPTSSISNSVNLLKTISNNVDVQIGILADILKQVEKTTTDFEIIAKKYFDENINIKTKQIKDFFSSVKTNIYTNSFNVLLDLTTDRLSNDMVLENKVVYDILKEKMVSKENTTLFVIYPNLDFIKKICIDSFYSDTNIVFVLDNDNITSICKTAINTDETKTIIADKQMRNYINYSKLGDVSIIVFGNRTIDTSQKIEDLKKIISESSKSKKLLLEFNIDKKNIDRISNNKQMNEYISSIHFFPKGIINETVPKKKSLIVYDIEKEDEISLYHYSVERIDDKQYIVRNPFISKIDRNTLNEDNNFRELYYSIENSYLRKSNNTRSQATIYHLSNHIDIHYSVDKNNKTKAYIKSPITGKRIINSVKEYRSKSLNDAIDWVSKDYIFETKKIDDNIVYILDIVSEEYHENLKNEELDFISLIVAYPEIYKELNDKKKDLLKEVIALDLGSLIVSECNVERILSCLEDGPTEKHKYDIIKLLSDFIDIAVHKKVVKHNAMKTQLSNIKKEVDKLYNMRQALMQRSLTVDEYARAYKLCTKRISKGKVEYLGILLKLFMPLDYDQICAICLSDIKTTSSFGEKNKITYIDVYRRLAHDNNGQYAFAKLRSPENYRKVVIPSIISDIVINCINDMKIITEGNKQDINDVCLISGNTDVAAVRKIMKPEDLSKLCRKFLKDDIRVSKEVIRLYDKDLNDYIEDDLSSYTGDFLKSNLKNYILSSDVCNFSINEMNYYFGYKQNVTHARNYIDYEADGSLLKQYIKLKNFERILKTDTTIDSNGMFMNESNHIIRTGNPLLRYITIVEGLKDDDEITISNEYGYTIAIIGGNKNG